MPIQIDDALTEAVVRELARRRGVTTIEAIKQAAEKMLVDDARAAQAKGGQAGD
ncbi:MAG: type II toxin-antitoxin system VapB family antitoxin [Phyllobacteriaceae bacterium]|nr:type II toxin-antitoxin system VapB family antitoxin [Phyllobacteriaceae bacterium]